MSPSQRRSSSNSSLIEFNCLGTLFIVREASLNRFPSTLLGCLWHRDCSTANISDVFLVHSGDPARRATFYDSSKQQYIVDRHIASFEAILNYYETGRLIAPSIYESMTFVQELKYFEFDQRTTQSFVDADVQDEFTTSHRLVPSNRISRAIWISLEYNDYSLATKLVSIVGTNPSYVMHFCARCS